MAKDAELEQIRNTHLDATFTVDHNVFSDRTADEMAMRLNSNAKLPFNQVIAPSDPADVVEHSNVSSFGDKNWCEQYCNTISD